jgi:hypothetical protein
VFIPNADVDFDDECHILLRAGHEDITVIARAVQVTEEGVGFQIVGMTRELRDRIAALVTLAKHVDLDRKKTLTRWLAGTEPSRRAAAGSVPPLTARRGAARVADGSISPIAAFAPTQRDEVLSEKVRAARRAAEAELEDTDD